VSELLKNKLVITVAGAGDFAALDLPISEFDTFDLLWTFQKKSDQFCKKTGERVYHPVGLQSLHNHFISKTTGKPIQQGFHRADEDAIANMEVFQVYTQIKKTRLAHRKDKYLLEEVLGPNEHFVTIKNKKAEWISLKRLFDRIHGNKSFMDFE